MLICLEDEKVPPIHRVWFAALSRSGFCVIDPPDQTIYRWSKLFNCIKKALKIIQRYLGT